jgi:hypothetical protein
MAEAEGKHVLRAPQGTFLNLGGRFKENVGGYVQIAAYTRVNGQRGLLESNSIPISSILSQVNNSSVFGMGIDYALSQLEHELANSNCVIEFVHQSYSISSTTDLAPYVAEFELRSGQDLAKMDIFSSDPYALISISGKTFKSLHLYKTLNPVWNQKFPPVGISHLDSVIRFDLFDEDKVQFLLLYLFLTCCHSHARSLKTKVRKR